MKRLYPDPNFLACRGRTRGSLGLAVLIVLAGLLVAGASISIYFRRDIADAYRQWQVAAIPPPPSAEFGAAGGAKVINDPFAKADQAAGPVSEQVVSAPDDSASAGLDPAVDQAGDAASGSGQSGSAGPAVGSGPETTAPPVESGSAEPPPGQPADGQTGQEPASPPAETAGTPPPGPSVLPDRVNLDVPMVYQAPFNVWDAYHEDACEEASSLMVQAFLTGTASLTRQEMEDRIQSVIGYELDSYGYFESTTAEQTAAFMRDYLGIARVAVLPVNSIDDIKRHLAAGRPVILPADGRTLGNPNFRNGGPIYHMLVVKGYTDVNLITNDPGTRRGANWLYDYDTIMNSLADWVQSSHSVNHDRKVMIVAW